MTKIIFLLALLCAATTIALTACTSGAKAEPTDIVISKDSMVKRGDYLVSTIGCDDCHSPKTMGPHGPELDLEHRLGGHLATSPIGKADPGVFKNGWLLFSMDITAAVGPWGVSYAANISSDETGIGSWTEEQFIRSIREGKSKGLAEGRPLLPPMPWRNFAKLTDTDIRSIYAYLKTTKPVVNVVPGPQPLSELSK